MSEAITTSELIRRAIDARLLDVHTAMPGKVRAWDAATQTADVEVMIKRSVPTGGDEEEPVLETLPVLPSVPVVFPGGGGCFLTFPMAVGDPVMLVFAERDTSQYRATGAVSDPGVQATHGLSGAVAFPCRIGPRSAALSGVESSGVEIGQANGGANVVVKASTTEVGGNSDASALASRVKALETHYLNHTHAVSGAATGVPNVAVPPYTAQTFDSAKLKVGG